MIQGDMGNEDSGKLEADMKTENEAEDYKIPAGEFAAKFLRKTGVREEDLYRYASSLLRLVLSWRRLNPVLRRGPSAAGAFFVEAEDCSGKAVKLLGIGPSEKTAVFDACGFLLKSSGISCPEALKAKLDIMSPEGEK